MADTTTVTLTLGFEDTDFTRKMKFTDVSNAALSGIAQKCKDINAINEHSNISEPVLHDEYSLS